MGLLKVEPFNDSTYYLTEVSADKQGRGVAFVFENSAGECLIGLVSYHRSLRLGMKIARLTGEAKGKALKNGK